MIHGLITLAWCVLCAVLRLPWPFYFWMPAFYMGREIAQSEYRYIQTHGGKRAACPWWCGFIPSAWTFKSLLDCLLPCIVSAIAWAVQAFLWH